VGARSSAARLGFISSCGSASPGREILKRYQKWKDVVEVSGPAGLRLIRGFRDEALSGEWKDHRSSRLNEQYRVIYRIESQSVVVEVVSVTPHDYRRK
jgi:addiction module RelE/StbE family toxin